MDYRGISGWGKVDALATALLKLTGLSVLSAEVEHIVQLYNDLDEFDKRPVTYRPRPQRPVRGRFARSKGNRSGHVSVDNVRR